MRTLLHGIFLGGALYAFLGALEVAWALALHPFHRDFGLFLRAIPWNLGLGGVAGMLSALLLPWLTRKAERRAFPGLHMGGALLGLLAGLVLFQWLTLSSLPQRAACAAVAGLLVQQILRWTFLTRMGWRIASLCAPLSVAGLLAATLLLTTGLSWLPVQPGPQAPPRPAAPHSGLPNELPAIKHVYWLHLEGIEQNQLGSFGYHRAVSPQLDQFITESSCVTPPQNGDPPPLFQEARFAAATFQDFGWRTRAFVTGMRTPTDPAHAFPLQEFTDFARPSLRRSLFVPGLVAEWGRWTSRRNDAEQAFQHTLHFEPPHDLTFTLLVLGDATPPHTPPAELEERFMPEGKTAALGRQDPPDMGALQSLQDAEIYALDQKIGRWLEELRNRDLLEASVVILSFEQQNLPTQIIIRGPQHFAAGSKMLCENLGPAMQAALGRLGEQLVHPG